MNSKGINGKKTELQSNHNHNSSNNNNHHQSDSDNLSGEEVDDKMLVKNSLKHHSNGSFSDSETELTNHQKPFNKRKFEKTKRTMDDVIKRLNKFTNEQKINGNGKDQDDHDEDHVNGDLNDKMLESAFHNLASTMSNSTDQAKIKETEQQLTIMINQLQQLKNKLVSKDQPEQVFYFNLN